MALALVMQRLVEPVLNQLHHRTAGGPHKVSATLTRHTPLSSRATEYAHSQVATVLDQVEARWGERLPGQDLFAWLLTQDQATQDQATLLELLAFGTASALDDMHARDGAERAQAVALVEALDVDMADWWQATPATYFDSVSKAQLIEAVTENAGTR